MSDFITLSCPNCGGKLDISPSTLTLVCQNCGTEHMVRRDAGDIQLESFARCPLCNRNDKAEKLTKFLKELPMPVNTTPSQLWFIAPLFLCVPFWGLFPFFLSPVKGKTKLKLTIFAVIYLGLAFAFVAIFLDVLKRMNLKEDVYIPVWDQRVLLPILFAIPPTVVAFVVFFYALCKRPENNN